MHRTFEGNKNLIEKIDNKTGQWKRFQENIIQFRS